MANVGLNQARALSNLLRLQQEKVQAKIRLFGAALSMLGKHTMPEKVLTNKRDCPTLHMLY